MTELDEQIDFGLPKDSGRALLVCWLPRRVPASDGRLNLPEPDRAQTIAAWRLTGIAPILRDQIVRKQKH